MKNDHEDAAREALSRHPLDKTLWDRVRDAMTEGGLDPQAPYHAFMVGRYVGEMLERGEYRGLTPKEATAFEEAHGVELPTRTR